MDLTQSQEQDKLIQYYLNQQIKKATDEKTQLTLQQQQERDKIKLQVWELLTQQQQVQNPTPLSLISNNSAQSDRFDMQMSKYKAQKFEQSMQFQKDLSNFQINYHSFVEKNNKDEQYKQLDKLIAQYEERNKQLPKNYFQKLPEQQASHQLEQDKEENDEYYHQEFEQDEEIQEDINEDLQESQLQIEQKSYKINQPEPETAYSNLIKLRIDRVDTSVVNGSKLNDLSKLSESLSDLKITPSETEKILEISKQIDASKLNTFKFDQTLLQTKSNDSDKNELYQPNSKLFELSQQQSKMYERKIDYPQMPSLDYDLSYRISDQSQIGRSYKPEQSKQPENFSKFELPKSVEQSKFDLPKSVEQSKFNNTKSQFDQSQRNNMQYDQEFVSKYTQKEQQQPENRQKDFQEKYSQFSKISDHQLSRFTEPLKRNQQSDLNYYPNQTCTNSNTTKVQMLDNDQRVDDINEEQTENYLEEEEEAFSEEDDHNNKFYQFSIKFEDQDEKEKQKKFEAIKKKKIQEMEELKQLRQQRNKEQQNNPSKQRDPSPLMPSASLKRLQQQQIQEMKNQQSQQQTEQKYYEQKQQQEQKYSQEQKYQPEQKYQQDQRYQVDQKQQYPPLYQFTQPQQQKNIFQDTSIQPVQPPPKRNVSANRKSPMSRQKETAHFCLDIDRSISVEKTKKSNKTMLKNAITYVCMAGEPNKRERESILQKLDGVEAEHFIILFKTFGRSDFRGLYGYAVDSQPYLIFGQGKCPQVLTPDLVKTFYKYDSGAKQFKAIDGNKQFTIMVDAVQLRK